MIKQKKNLMFLNKLFPMLIVIVCLLMSVGYATVNDVSLNIGGEAVAMELEGVYVNNIAYVSNVGANTSKSNLSVLSNSVLKAQISLSSSNVNSNIKYKVSIVNTFDYEVEFFGISFDSQFYDNSGIVMEYSGISIGDVIQPNDVIDLYITFKYVNSVNIASSGNTLNAYINVEFGTKPILIASSENDTFAFRNSEYKEKITIISFEDKIKIPSYAVESWDIGVHQNGDVMAYIEDLGEYYKLHIQSNGKIYANEDMSYWFAGLTNVSLVNNISLLDTSNVVDMSYMFYDFGSRNTSNASTELDLTGWDTSKVINMSYMFMNFGASTGLVALNLGDIDTSSVTDMSAMFLTAGYYANSFNLQISNLNTSKVTNMEAMFMGTGCNVRRFNIDVSGFDTTNVTNMNMMFLEAGKTSTIFVTSFTIRNPNVSYTDMFFEAAKGSGSSITVNYTSKTSSIINNIVNTKSPDSNVSVGASVS